MEPNYLNIEPRAPFIIYNAPKLYPDEIFVQVIYYDGTVIPQYYISNYGRLYSCYYNRILNPTVDDKGYYRTTIKVGDNKVSDVAEFRYQLYSHKVGETISITVIRNGKTVDLKVKLGSK